MLKKCRKCSLEKDVSDFYVKTSSKKDGYVENDPCFYVWACKECLRARQVAWRKKNPDRGKDVDLFQSFGIRFEDYTKMYDDQKGCCGICNRHSSMFRRSLAVDHDHITGNIRGLLCDACNVTIGKTKENINWLQNCISYLEKHSSELADKKTNVIELQLRKVG